MITDDQTTVDTGLDLCAEIFKSSKLEGKKDNRGWMAEDVTKNIRL